MTSSAPHSLLCASALGKRFTRRHAADIQVLEGLEFEMHPGHSHSILGKSGSGKSTLIHILAGFDQPTQGSVAWQGRNVRDLSMREIDRARRQMFGFVHQHHHLMSDLSALDNVAIPLRIDGMSKKAAHALAQDWLERVGLPDRADHMPGELSGGERQRVGIARALVNSPRLVIADEPTGNLDKETGASIIRLLETLQSETGASLILVTHDIQIAASTQFQWVLQQGRLASLQSITQAPVSTPGVMDAGLNPSG